MGYVLWVVLCFTLTLIVGDTTVKGFADFVQRRINPNVPYVEAIPGGIVGAFERALAFTLFFLSVEGTLAILGAWIGAKLAANWQRRTLPDNDRYSRWIRGQTFKALMAGVLSLGVGAAGGSAARCALPSENPSAFCSFVDRELIAN
jgi:hypothetical protein